MIRDQSNTRVEIHILLENDDHATITLSEEKDLTETT
jgi:hypothetical protein